MLYYRTAKVSSMYQVCNCILSSLNHVPTYFPLVLGCYSTLQKKNLRNTSSTNIDAKIYRVK